jgi:phosphoribosylanthranilate isomerase
MRQGAVQIAGIADADEARLLVDCGVDFLGFPFRLAFHQEDCNEEDAARIVASLPARVEAVLITYLLDPGEIAALAHALGVHWVQLHGNIEPDALAELRGVAPHLSLAKSLVVRGGDATELHDALGRFAPLVDAFLTDSFDPATEEGKIRNLDTRVFHHAGRGKDQQYPDPEPACRRGGVEDECLGDVARGQRKSGDRDGPDNAKDGGQRHRFV